MLVLKRGAVFSISDLRKGMPLSRGNDTRDRDADCFTLQGPTVRPRPDFLDGGEVADHAPHSQSKDPYLCHPWTPHQAAGFSKESVPLCWKIQEKTDVSMAVANGIGATVAIQHRHGNCTNHKSRHKSSPRIGQFPAESVPL